MTPDLDTTSLLNVLVLEQVVEGSRPPNPVLDFVDAGAAYGRYLVRAEGAYFEAQIISAESG